MERSKTFVDSLVGSMIAVTRGNARLTRKSLAVRTGIAITDLKAYESGEKPVPARQLIRIAEALNAPLSRFFGAAEIAQCANFDGLRPDALDPEDCARVLAVFSQIRSPKIFDAAVSMARDLALLDDQLGSHPSVGT